ncbi:SOS response-associated peptidase [Arsenicitalea aurantiaca]|uniref:Abasic site processing protein n=1 Tax=Arsenicitalea aurantiaca TaxID=1783274 RepID=A0A433XAM8_9HYPH|nr:SOS response-associated peptidase [Arsenicitalea aurantiaca]RUT31125.1 SOS response-associated peptidase [Arsenicitalea aurantiaca]
MCGRYAVTLPPDAMVEFFQLLNRIEYPARYNIAPTQPIAAIWEEAGQRRVHLVRWGFVPGWVKDPREFPLIINARVEGMDRKPAFRDALKNTRCIVPASGYFEWHTRADGKKQPYFITRADGRPMALAGLHATWSGPDGEEIDSAATITVPASADLAHIHDRMPAILPEAAIGPWLDVRNVRAPEAHQLALPLPEGALKFHPVSTRVNSARFDDPELIEEVVPEAPEPPRLKKAGGSGQLDLF